MLPLVYTRLVVVYSKKGGELPVKMTKNQEYKEENSIRCTLRFYKTTGIPDALMAMQEATGVAWTLYAKKAVADALVRDGFLSEKGKGESND